MEGAEMPVDCCVLTKRDPNIMANAAVGPSLRDSFLRFKKEREKFLSDERFHADVPRTPEQKDRIRAKFLERAMSYQGVPYARRYHEPGSTHYDAPLFLDCCALVRKALNDLKHDFGFTLGRWNQAYQFDTLPDTGIKSHEELKPGDLIFYSGTYFNEKSRRQKHDMVHVEIYVGPGERSLGARWQKGVVTIFDSFKFESKAYHSVQHHFRSIERWLSGDCQSICSEHPWRRKVFDVSRKSIFYAGVVGEQQPPGAGGESDEEGEDEAASDGEAPDGGS